MCSAILFTPILSSMNVPLDGHQSGPRILSQCRSTTSWSLQQGELFPCLHVCLLYKTYRKPWWLPGVVDSKMRCDAYFLLIPLKKSNSIRTLPASGAVKIRSMAKAILFPFALINIYLVSWGCPRKVSLYLRDSLDVLEMFISFSLS